MQDKAASHICALQFGVGVPGGCEGIKHAVRSILSDRGEDKDNNNLLQIGYDNAFNNLDGTKLFEEVSRSCLRFWPGWRCHTIKSLSSTSVAAPSTAARTYIRES